MVSSIQVRSPINWIKHNVDPTMASCNGQNSTFLQTYRLAAWKILQAI